MRLVRPALPVDREAIIAIHCASWRDSYRGIMPEEELGEKLAAEKTALWSSLLEDLPPGYVVLVAVEDYETCGFISSHPDQTDSQTDFISALHVLPDKRGRGMGAELTREWADRLSAIGRRRAALLVADANTSARRFYRRLGGFEGPVFIDGCGTHAEVEARRFCWDAIETLSVKARAERIRRLAPPATLHAADVTAWTGAAHPVASAERARARRKQPLGEQFGISDFGVNRVEISPGAVSTVPHFHSHEDEFVFVLEGILTLRLDGSKIEMRPGDCAGFPAGEGPSHMLENRSDSMGVYLEIGSRWPGRDRCRYPDEDLHVAPGPDGNPWFLRLDGTQLAKAD